MKTGKGEVELMGSYFSNYRLFPSRLVKFMFLFLFSFFTLFFFLSPDDCSAGVCVNTYCHGNVPGLTASSQTFSGYVDPVSTNPATGKCGTCHRTGKFSDSAARRTDGTTVVVNTAPAGGSHFVHASTATYNFSCKFCHSATLTNWGNSASNVTISTSYHVVNRATDIQFSTSSLTGRLFTGTTPQYDNRNAYALDGTVYSTAPPDGVWGKCTNLYCHGSIYDKYLVTRATPTWGDSTTGDCGTCHGAGKNYTGSLDITKATAPAGGSHYLHVSTTAYNYDCDLCHRETVRWDGTRSVISSYPAHIDYATEVRFATRTILTRSQVGISSPTYNNLDAYNTAYSTSPTDGSFPTPGCANLYCHGAITAQYAVSRGTPTWGSAVTGDCGVCHNSGIYDISSPAPPAGWQHTTHASSAPFGGNYNYQCRYCHEVIVSWSGVISSYPAHAQGLADIKFSTSALTTGTGTASGFYKGFVSTANAPTASNNYKYCANIYCHSKGTKLWVTGAGNAALTATALNAVTVYSSHTVTCSSCHDFLVGVSTVGPVYTLNVSSGGKPNAHPRHTGYDCSDCHKWTVNADYTIRYSSHHVDGLYTSTPTVPYNFTYVQRTTPTASTCDNISCHNYKNAVWSDTATLNCVDCHMPTTAKDESEVDSFKWQDGFVASISSIGWYNTGHGLGAGSKYDSKNSSAGFYEAGGSTGACYYCHSRSINHNTANNYFRLTTDNYNYTTTTGMNNVCLVCHRSGSAGYNGGGTLPSKNGTAKVAENHYGNKHNTGDIAGTRDGGDFCWDCHDPHGDFEISPSTWVAYMIHRRPVELTTGTVVGTDNFAVPYQLTNTSVSFRSSIAGSTGTFDWGDFVAPAANNYRGVCQVCHDTNIGYFNQSTYASGHNSGQPCTDCHQHDKKFAAACNTCHGGATSGLNLSASSPSNYWPDGSTRTATNTADRTGAHEKHIFAIASRFGYVTDAGTITVDGLSDTNQKKYCSYCHGNEMTPGSLSGSGTNSGHFDSNSSTAPATLPGIGISTSTVHGFKTLKSTWVVASSTWVFWTQAEVDNASFTFTADNAARYCDNSDCHWNTRTPVANFGWYGADNVSTPTPAGCNTCHRDTTISGSSWPATAGAHAKHAGVSGWETYAYGCDKCHSPVYTVMYPTAPYSPHMDVKVQWSFAGLQADPLFKSTVSVPSYTTPSGFTYGFTGGSSGTCSGLYCHGLQTTPRWDKTWTNSGFTVDDGTATKCGACHERPPTRKSGGSLITYAHDVHTSTHDAPVGATAPLGVSSNTVATEYRYGCGFCHYDTNPSTTTLDITQHAQGRIAAYQAVRISFTVFSAGSPAANYAPVTLFWSTDTRGFAYSTGTCNSIYCHGVSFSSGTRVQAEDVTVSTPSWNVNLGSSTSGGENNIACGSCHNLFKSETHIHKQHIGGVSGSVGNYTFDCAECHREVDNNPTDYKADISSRTVHVNKTYNVTFSTYIGGYVSP